MSLRPAGEACQESFSRITRQVAVEHGFTLDSAQDRALVQLERLHGELTEAERSGRSWLRMFQRPRPIRGLYLWGGVGRGKSFLMDIFFDALPLERKRRVHFHRFMQDIHHRLKAVQGEENPLARIAAEISAEARLLCLDEFQVSDIGDAMLMRNLLAGLFDRGAVLVTTSNQHPDELYLHGLQRAQFLPAIELLKNRLDIVQVEGGTDYRLRVLEKDGVYHFPLDAVAERAMEHTFESVAGTAGKREVELEIEGRVFKARRMAPGVGWFEFESVCNGPRGQADYIELARRFHTVLISQLRRFAAGDTDRQRRFTWLVDEFYDRRVKLILSAEDRLPELFHAARVGTETDRTISRLTEMQTRNYLSEPHLS
ncbi:MAG TPA: cell division protein ZapE [Burkholderiales bacterium]|nr:cell division protein ZapE [Burkholderiales bacterium]